MPGPFEWFKVVADNNLISKNKWLIMWFLVGSGATGNVVQGFQVHTAEKYVKEADHNTMIAVTEVARAFQGTYKPPATPVVKPVPTKVIINKVNCSTECAKQTLKHEQIWHGVRN